MFNLISYLEKLVAYIIIFMIGLLFINLIMLGL
jgi:hypothetical protein